MRKTQQISLLLLLLTWLCLSLACWLHSPEIYSLTERRRLRQFPQLTVSSLQSGQFADAFDSYSQDQFPAREVFRGLKAATHMYLFGQTDNHGVYRARGYLAKLEYTLNQASVHNAVSHFESVCQQYLVGKASRIVMAVIPDKGHYLAPSLGYPTLDQASLLHQLQQETDSAEWISLESFLSLESYYKTDPHWRQETLEPAVEALAQALDVPLPVWSDYRLIMASDSFRGLYSGQIALPVPAESLNYLTSPALEQCTVFSLEDKETGSIYCLDKTNGPDPYDLFLSGAVPFLTIENPSALTDRHLIVFRDSFGSSLVPLLASSYARIDVVDLRYLSGSYLPTLLTFDGADALFLYSSSVLNDSSTLK